MHIFIYCSRCCVRCEQLGMVGNTDHTPFYFDMIGNYTLEPKGTRGPCPIGDRRKRETKAYRSAHRHGRWAKATRADHIQSRGLSLATRIAAAHRSDDVKAEEEFI